MPVTSIDKKYIYKQYEKKGKNPFLKNYFVL